MASVNSVSSSNANSLYGNRNVISGLASGMDTESMIQNAVSGIRTKISGLLQKQTKLSWQQEAYWNVSDKLVQFSRKYASFTSATNLMSGSYFNKSVITTANGANASKVTATGKTGSKVRIDGVGQLAAASRYQIDSGGVLDSVKTITNAAGDTLRLIEGSGRLNLADSTSTSNLAGNLTLNYGNKLINLNFSSGQVFTDAQDFADEINRQLSEQDVMTSGGGSSKASDLIKVEVKDGKIAFSDKAGGGNSVYIAGVGGKLNQTLGELDYSDNDIKEIDLSDKTENDLKTVTTVLDRIEGKTMNFSLDGSGKKITLPTKDELAAYKAENGSATDEAALVGLMNEKLKSAFGAGKVTAALSGDGELQFIAAKEGSNLVVSSEVNEAMGLKGMETTYLNTGKTLGDFLGDNLTDDMALEGVGDPSQWTPVEDKDGFFTDKDGNLVKDGYRVDADGNKMYSLTINGKQIGAYSKETALETVMVDINSNTEAGVNVTYSKTTNQFVFNASETGAGHDISIGADDSAPTKDLGKLLFGEVDKTSAKYTDGKDAIMQVTVNDSTITMTRSSNTFDIDGLSVTVNGTFNSTMVDDKPVFNTSTEAVTFTSKADTDKLMETIKSFVTDYNDMIKTLREGFATMPLKKSDKSRYEPLTDDDMEGMSETAIENYNEKAKTGIIFGDADLSALYSKLTSAISPSGADGTALRNIGITSEYSEGLTTLSLDENALREALNTNPDSVRDAFSKVAGSGSATNGLMVNLKKNLDTYVSTEGFKGILVNKAGSKYSATSLLQNSIKTQIESYDEQVEKWQTKLSDKVDYYTGQFSRLEQLIAQMNSQSSSLQSMMGGG